MIDKSSKLSTKAKVDSCNGDKSLADLGFNCLGRLAARRWIRYAIAALAALLCIQLFINRAYAYSLWDSLTIRPVASQFAGRHSPAVQGFNATAATTQRVVVVSVPKSEPPRLPSALSQPQGTIAGGKSETCPEQPPGLLGDKFPVPTNPEKAPSWLELETALPEVRHGGSKPAECVARQRVAIIIPFRNRDNHLRLLLSMLHPFLRRQQLDYRIFVIEQSGSTRFNRAMLFNIGFVEVNRTFHPDCYIFHDVDLLPEHDHNIYRCGDRPRHMTAAVDKFNYQLPYEGIFGGACALTESQFRSTNGFSNLFFGWGGEDDDFRNRVVWAGYQIARYPMTIARYKMIKHQRDNKNDPNPMRVSLINQGRGRWKQDGLNSLDYKVVGGQDRQVAFILTVDIPEARVLKKFNLS